MVFNFSTGKKHLLLVLMGVVPAPSSCHTILSKKRDCIYKMRQGRVYPPLFISGPCYDIKQ